MLLPRHDNLPHGKYPKLLLFCSVKRRNFVPWLLQRDMIRWNFIWNFTSNTFTNMLEHVRNFENFCGTFWNAHEHVYERLWRAIVANNIDVWGSSSNFWCYLAGTVVRRRSPARRKPLHKIKKMTAPINDYRYRLLILQVQKTANKEIRF